MDWRLRVGMGDEVIIRRSSDVIGRPKDELSRFDRHLLLQSLRRSPPGFMVDSILNSIARYVSYRGAMALPPGQDRQRIIDIVEHGLERRHLFAIKGLDPLRWVPFLPTARKPPQPEPEPAPPVPEPPPDPDVWVNFSEELPTARRTTQIDFQGKWIYVVCDGKVVVTVDGVDKKRWHSKNDLFGESGDVTDGWVRLQPDREYRFLLSPIALPQSVQNELARLSTSLERLTILPPKQPGRYQVALRDPMAWTVELHARRYRPALEKWQAWAFDESRASELFIASVLKELIGTDDDLGVQGHLQEGQPTKWIDGYEKEASELMQRAERAMAEIAGWCDSGEHRLIEAAALETGGDDLALVLVQWSAALADAAQCRPGTQLLLDVVNDGDRVPRKLLMPEQATPPNDLDFAQHRYIYLAAVSLLGDLSPAIAVRLRGNPDQRELLKLWLERLGEGKPERGHYRQIKRNIEEGRSLTHELRVKNKHQRVRKLILDARDAQEELVKLPPTFARAERMTASYNRAVGDLVPTMTLTLELANMGMALTELLDESGSSEQSLMRAISALGAASDLGIVLAESSEVIIGQYVAKKAGRDIMKRLGKNGLRNLGRAGTRALMGALGAISGVCDAIDFSLSAVGAAKNHDYNAMVAHGFAAAGAVTVCIGSGILIAGGLAGVTATSAAGLAGGLSLTGLGTIVAVIGAALIAASSFIANLLTDNAYQLFAAHSFLGEESDAERIEADWLPALLELPNSVRFEEAQVLIALLSNFRTSALSFDDVRIFPGYYTVGDLFEVYVHRRFKTGGSPLMARFFVDPTTGDVDQVAGNRLLTDKHEVQFNSAGRATTIKIVPADAFPDDRIKTFQAQTMWVRLLSRHGFTVPPRSSERGESWHVSTFSGVGLASGATGGSSLDPEHRATDRNPPPSDLPSIR